jgi:acetyl esterase/lipase
MRAARLLALFGACAWFAPLPAADASLFSPERLQEYLKQYPEADANKDGVLTIDEARAYLRQLRGGAGQAAKKNKSAPAAEQPAFAPTFADVAYGPHDRNVLDFWQAKSEKPTPVVVFIHGGGFTSGDKSKAGGKSKIQPYLDAGVSFAAINYRYRTTAPIQDVLRDCARAIQFIRSKSAEWNIDKTRLASCGGSAGAGTSLWLAFHDDLADPSNPDPVLRESTRLTCAAANATQFSYDILRWPEVLGEDVARRFGEGTDAPRFYGFTTDAELRSPAGEKIRADCDMHGLITRDDPPVFLSTTHDGGPIRDRGAFLHHPKHAQAIYDRCRELGVTAVADLPGLALRPPADGPATERAFLLKFLLAPPSRP